MIPTVLRNTLRTVSSHPQPYACCMSNSNRSRPWASSHSQHDTAFDSTLPWTCASIHGNAHTTCSVCPPGACRTTGICRWPRALRISPWNPRVSPPQIPGLVAAYALSHTHDPDIPNTVQNRSAFAHPAPCSFGTGGWLSTARYSHACTCANPQRPYTLPLISVIMPSMFSFAHGFSPP